MTAAKRRKIVASAHLVSERAAELSEFEFGLITASIWVLLQNLRPLPASSVLWLVLGTLAGLVIVNLVATDTPEDTWFIFICGGVAISAMLLPGISGSFILLLLRKYAYVFDAIGRLDLGVSNFSHDHDTLYRNEGGLLFTDVSFPSGLGTSSRRTSPGP